MSNVPGDLRYTRTHEWIRLEPNGDITMGITDHAQELMGDIVMTEIPAKGMQVRRGDPLGALEAVKTAEDYYAPADGTVVDVNSALESEPGLVNSACYGQGWLVRITPSQPSQLEELLTPEQYKKLIGE